MIPQRDFRIFFYLINIYTLGWSSNLVNSKSFNLYHVKSSYQIFLTFVIEIVDCKIKLSLEVISETDRRERSHLENNLRDSREDPTEFE